MKLKDFGYEPDQVQDYTETITCLLYMKLKDLGYEPDKVQDDVSTNLICVNL